MPDRDGTLNMHPERSLAEALRALPLESPPGDLWPGLAQSLGRRRRPWRRAIPFALAAGIALALLLPRLTSTPPRAADPAADPPTIAQSTAQSTAPAAGAGDVELAALHRRSQSLERWISAFAAHAPQDSRDLMAAVEVEDLIGLVDVQLGAARGDDDALPLWRQRVALLEDLATIRRNGFAVAANDDGAMGPASHLLN
jgi:hypothetical protein